MHCCLSVFLGGRLCFLFGPYVQGSCQATIHVSYSFTFTHISILTNCIIYSLFISSLTMEKVDFNVSQSERTTDCSLQSKTCIT